MKPKLNAKLLDRAINDIETDIAFQGETFVEESDHCDEEEKRDREEENDAAIHALEILKSFRNGHLK